MQIANIDAVDIVFDLLFPPIGALIVYGCAYAVARAIAGGSSVSQPTKTVLWFSSLLALGIGYDMALTKLLGFSRQTLWVTLPIWALVLIVLTRRRYQTKKQSQDPTDSPST